MQRLYEIFSIVVLTESHGRRRTNLVARLTAYACRVKFWCFFEVMEILDEPFTPRVQLDMVAVGQDRVHLELVEVSHGFPLLGVVIGLFFYAVLYDVGLLAKVSQIKVTFVLFSMIREVKTMLLIYVRLDQLIASFVSESIIPQIKLPYSFFDRYDRTLYIGCRVIFGQHDFRCY